MLLSSHISIGADLLCLDQQSLGEGLRGRVHFDVEKEIGPVFLLLGSSAAAMAKNAAIPFQAADLALKSRIQPPNQNARQVILVDRPT